MNKICEIQDIVEAFTRSQYAGLEKHAFVVIFSPLLMWFLVFTSIDIMHILNLNTIAYGTINISSYIKLFLGKCSFS